LDARLRLLPRRTTEPIERRARRARVLLHEIEPFDRNEQLVLPRVAELHELLRFEADLDALQPDEHADAVIDMDDEVVDLEVAEIREKGAGCRPPAFVGPRPLIEDLRLDPRLPCR